MKKRNVKQRMLQISFGLGVIFFAFLIELMAVHPSGIYSYVQQKGYKEFQIGFSKEQVLKKINKRKTIRTIRTCDPDKLFQLKSRKVFEMEAGLASSDVWLCQDRTGKDFLFVFKGAILERILIQRLRLGKKEGSILFSQCSLEIFKGIDYYLTSQKKLKVFYDTDSKEKN